MYLKFKQNYFPTYLFYFKYRVLFLFTQNISQSPWEFTLINKQLANPIKGLKNNQNCKLYLCLFDNDFSIESFSVGFDVEEIDAFVSGI